MAILTELPRPSSRTNAKLPAASRPLSSASTHKGRRSLITMLKERDAAALDTWLAHAQASGIPSLAGVANGMRVDYSAAATAVTDRWSNGPVEGWIHQIKLLKRQGYRRASFTLLRRQLLTA